MKYVAVSVRSARYHGGESLTYSTPADILPGTIVLVQLQREIVPGVVVSASKKPSFPTKPVRETLPYRIPLQHLELMQWLQDYYPAPFGQIVAGFIPGNIATKERSTTKAPADNSTDSLEIKLPKLTSEQVQALDAINKARNSSILLHGDTGTGKTRIYLEVAKKTLQQGRSVIALTPEIGLTPQLAQAFKEVFSERVVVMHSGLTSAARRKLWQFVAQSTKPLVVIGPRSALFAPLSNVGLILMDECHDGAYKQEQAPHYQTQQVAAKLAKLHNAPFIMGSATPSIQDYFVFIAKKLPIIRLKTLALHQKNVAPAIAHVVSLRDKSQFSRSSLLSDQLCQAITTALQQKEQSLLFLNRRGTARVISCTACGWQATCPRCDLPLTYHGDSHIMRCHTCGYRAPALSSCPDCKSTDIHFKSPGTKRLLEEVERLFPDATVKRFDSDTLGDARFEKQYDKVKQGDGDILIGTQLLSKGLDLPLLSTVGLVMADTALSFPDYTAEERSYQMISQVIGRVNRGHRSGTIVIQTLNPESPLIQAALGRDYESYYASQIRERETFRFPPFQHLLKLQCERANSASAMKAAETLAAALLGIPGIEVVGPAPAFIEKNDDKYRWQIVVKSPSRSRLLHCISELPSGWTYDIDPSNLL